MEKIDFSKPNWGVSGSQKSKRKKISKTLRDQVWFKYMGGDKAEGRCYCCKIRPIHITDFEVGHNKPSSKGGKDHINNLRPICRICNRGMGSRMTIEGYKKKHYGKTTTKKLKKKKTKKKKPTKKTPTILNPNGYFPKGGLFK